VVDVLEVMEFDDVVDLFLELFVDMVEYLLGLMEFEEVVLLWCLFIYDEDIVGGLMISELVILVLEVMIVEVFVVVCCVELSLVLVVSVFVCCLLLEMLIGWYLGLVYI